MKFILIFLSIILCSISFKINIKNSIKRLVAGTIISTTIAQPVQAISYINEKFDHKMEHQIDNKNNKNDVTYPNIDKILLDLNRNLNFQDVEKTYITVDRNNIYFYGQVTSDSCRVLAEKLNELNKNAVIYKSTLKETPPPINLHIQSPGGSLMNTFYIIDLIEKMETPVNTYVDGYAASAASLISVVGKKRYMTQNSLMLIHQLSGGNEGKFEEMDDEMKNLNLFMNIVKKIYLSKTSIKPIMLEDILKHDIWLSSDQCKDLGLVDEII